MPNDGFGRGKSVSKCSRTRGHIRIGHRPEVPMGNQRERHGPAIWGASAAVVGGVARRMRDLLVRVGVGAPERQSVVPSSVGDDVWSAGCRRRYCRGQERSGLRGDCRLERGRSMTHDIFVVRVGSALLVTGLVLPTAACGGDASVPAASTNEVDLRGDGCSTRMPVGSDGPVLNDVVEPTPEHGAVAWSIHDAGGSDVGSVAAASEVVFIGAGAAVSALTLADGTSRWRQNLDVGDLPPVSEDGMSTFIELAVGYVLAVALTERAMTLREDSAEFGDRSVVAALDPATGAQRWVSEVFEGGPAPLLWRTPLEVIDDLVVVEVSDGSNDTVRGFDVATGSPRWQADGRLAGGGSGTVFIYRQDQCLIHAVDAADGVERWSLPTPPPQQLSSPNVPVQVITAGDDVVVVWSPNDAPVVVARVDASTGGDVWRFHLPAGGLVEADVLVDKTSLRLAIQRHAMDTGSALIDVFDLDPHSGEARWAIQIPQSGTITGDVDEILAANPFTPDTEVAVVAGKSTILVSTGTHSYELSASDGTVARMLDVEATLAALLADPGREMIMRSLTLPDGVVATASDTVAMIQ